MDSKNQIKIIGLLKKYLNIATKDHPQKDINKYFSYYYGDQETRINNYNIVKSIINTKKTLILDNNLVASIIPKNLSFSNLQQIKTIKNISDILDDCKNSIMKLNKFERFKSELIENMLISNIGIAEICWDNDLSNGLGDVSLKIIDSDCFFPDPSAKKIDNCSYVFVKSNYSIVSFLRKYPERKEFIDKLSFSDSSKTSNSQNKVKGIITYETNSKSNQLYSTENDVSGINRLDKTVEIWSAYLKDETIFNIDKEDEKDLNNEKFKFMYPNGRLIIFSGEMILEDKPIDYPFGMPFEIIKQDNGPRIFSIGGTVKDIMPIQDRLNRAYDRLRKLIAQYLSMIVIDPASGITKKDIINQSILELDPNTIPRGLAPTVLTNNTLSEIESLLKYIEFLKNEARETARVNEQMISGERQTGVTSGDMVDALNESPQTSIRDIQKNFSEFIISVTNKIIVLIQKYYNQQRIIKLSSGNFAMIPLITPENDEISITLFNELGQSIGVIKGGFNIGEFDTDIISGSEMPRSRSQTSQLTMQLANSGIIGNINDIDTKEMILESLDYPNYRAIMNKQRLAEAKRLENYKPNAISLIEKMGFSFKDIESFPEAQQKILMEFGLLTNPDINQVNEGEMQNV